MIDCLSNPNWINPQIDFLLFLQNLRIGHLEIFDKFFLSITVFGEFWLPTLICAVTYWCIDFRAGIYLFSLMGMNSLITHFFKMIACVYRPWVLSYKIHPSELAVPYAKGYSFPSGHSAMSSSVLGGTAFLTRKNKILCTFLICLVFLIGFSRMWLGVHTPQDVICGLLIGFTLIFVMNKVINWAEEKQNRYLILTLLTDVFIVLATIYIYKFNTYKLDYIDGCLLVNPIKQIYVTIVVWGYILGLLNGVFLCRRFFPFNPHEASVSRRIVRGIIGAVGVILILKYIIAYIIMNGMQIRYAFPIMFGVGLFITLFYPIIFQRFEKSVTKK